MRGAKSQVRAIGITGSINYGVIPLEETRKDYARVLSNGVDTVFLSSSDGQAFALQRLSEQCDSHLAPRRMGALAHWTFKEKRVAIALNRNGEILVVKDGELKFAKRRGKWTYFPHQAVIASLGVGSKVLREAIYESCIDASFARTGACIAIIEKSKVDDLSMIRDGDLLKKKHTGKTKFLSKIVGKKTFQALDRQIRQELLAMDGATVLSHRGEVIAMGAIVAVAGGAIAGGGRRAAAEALSECGVGIKVSADGPIAAYRNRREIVRIGGHS